MRGTLRAVGLFLLMAAVLGCAKDKYGMNAKFREEVVLPPTGQARYDQPDTADYRKPPPEKQDKTLMNRPGGGPGPGGLGGF
jgi:hypothetical protein